MSFQVISHEEFEAARQAFVAAWLEADSSKDARRIAGERTTQGLTAALATLHIKEEEW